MEHTDKALPPLSFPLLSHPAIRQIVKHGIDIVLAGTAWIIAGTLWLEKPWNTRSFIHWILFTFIVNMLFRLTSTYYRMTGFEDARRLGTAVSVIAGTSILLRLLATPLQIDLDVPQMAFASSILTGMLWGTLRVGCRVWNERHVGSEDTDASQKGKEHRTLVIGAGKAGALVAQELLRHPNLGYEAIGFIDDASEKQNLLIHGLPVLGRSTDLKWIVPRHGITHAILAIPSVSGKMIRQLNEDLKSMHVQVKTVPGIFNLLGPQTWKPVLRDVSIEDVLRRDPVQLDTGTLGKVVEGATILITGAGGSIGSELARQVAGLNPGHIILLGRGENSLWRVEREFHALFPRQAYSLELMDIRNELGLRDIFERHRPKIVFHAAAHKHVPFLETHPCEAVLNNIFGTQNVVQAALDFGTKIFVNISTDKAVNPTNVLGASKRIAECIVLDASERSASDCRFVSVRFGNVLGSRGSVVPIFREQIRKGGPVTVTSPEMTRYFMTIPEASQLVIQAGLLGGRGKVYVLDMGEPVKILDLATDMIRFSGFTPGLEIDIQFVGLRPGEKLHEELFLDAERMSTNLHAKLFETNPQGMTPEALQEGLERFRKAVQLPYEQRQPEIVANLRAMVPTYSPSLLGVGKYGGHVKNRRERQASLPPGFQCRRKNRTTSAA
jgi:FlaA1/EpsC-like NDP-sugar epimerase